MTSSSTAMAQAPVSAKISLRQSADPRRVLADRVDQLYSQLPLAIASTFVLSVVAAYELREGRFFEIVVFWGGLVLLLTAASTGLYWSYRRSANKLAEAGQWLRWLGISALAAGATWGFAGAVFFPSHADEQQVFLAFLLSVLVAGGVPIYAVSWPIYAAYAAGILFPFTYVLATFGNRLFAEVALIVPVFYLLNVGIAYRLNQVFDSGYRLRHAYGKLTEDYTALNQRLEQQLLELEEARRQVEASGRKLALFAERSPIAVFEFDPEGRILTMNPAAETLFGYSSSELIGRAGADTLFSAAAKDDNPERWRSLLRSPEPLFGLRLVTARRDGAEIVCEWSLTPLVNQEQRVISVIVQGRDITQQLEAERMKKEFTSTLSHELRTPLTSIIGSLQLINSGVMGEIEKDIAGADLDRRAQRPAAARPDQRHPRHREDRIGQADPVYRDAGAGTSWSASRWSLNRGFADRFKVRLATAGDLPPVKVGADRKRAAAGDDQPALQRGEVLARGRHRGSDHGEHRRRGARRRARLAGPASRRASAAGSSAASPRPTCRITRQKGGTGLGLAICKRLLEMMGGRIGFADRAGGGTTFWFELPKQG